jgi:Polyketide cyclase / dehydrase and lipid transport
MIRVAKSATLSVDRSLAFDYITNPGNWPQFWPNLISLDPIDDARWRQPGDTMALQMRLGGRVATLHMTLEEFRYPELVRYRSVQYSMPETAHERIFLPVDGGFTYQMAVEFAPRPGMAGLFDRTIFRYATRRALHRTIGNLRRRLTPSTR